MQKTIPESEMTNAITRYFAKAELPTQQYILGEIATDILNGGQRLNRKSICIKLLSRLENAENSEQELHLNQLIGLLFE